MSQCGIRWRGTCNRRIMKKGDNSYNAINGANRQTLLTKVVQRLLESPVYKQEPEQEKTDRIVDYEKR